MTQKNIFNIDDAFQFERELGDEERLIMESARRYAQEKLESRVIKGNQDEYFDINIAKEMGEMGLLGSFIDPKYGGGGTSYTTYGLVAREVERVDSGYRSFMSVQTSLVMFPIQYYGNEQQKNAFLPSLASGEKIGCFGLTEPNHGSDPASMESTAKKVDGGWILNGNKMWITNSPIADIAIVWTKEKGVSGDKSIMGFILERGMKGFTTPKTKYKMSLRASETGEIVMEDVFVPESHCLHTARGLKAPFSCLNSARYGIVWGALGAAELCYQKARQYVQERKQFGLPLAANQLIQTKLANMLTDITTMQLLAWRLGILKDNDKLHPSMVSLAKRYNCGTALKIARIARDMLGGNGISGEYRVIHHVMNLESVNTYEGTYDIHGLILGRQITDIQAFVPKGNG